MRKYIAKQEYQDMRALHAGVPLLEPKILGTIEARDAGEALHIACRRYGIEKPLIGIFPFQQDQEGGAEQ